MQADLDPTTLARLAAWGSLAWAGQRRLALGMGGVALFAAAAFAYDGAHVPALPEGARSDAFFLAAFAFTMALGALASYARWRDGRKHPVVRQIVERPSEIVWVYRITVRRSGRDLIHFALESGKDGGHLLVNTTEGADAMAMLGRTLPHATFGATAELRAKYLESPASLRRSG